MKPFSSSLTAPMWMTPEDFARPEAARTDEFAPGAAEWPEGLSRRDFLRAAGGTLALAGLSGCMRLPEKPIVPYTEQPEKVIPGRPLHFATTIQVNGSPRGVVVRSNEGRPTHIAGNPRHPLSLGATDVWTTAALYDFYDPDRLQFVQKQGSPTAWSEFVQNLLTWRGEWDASQGAGLAFLMPPVDSPSESRLLAQVLATFPQAVAFTYDPIFSFASTISRERCDLAQAQVIFALESNFLLDRPDSLALTRAFSRRRNSDDGSTWNRLYVAESCPTITGVKADHRFVVAPQDLDALAAALLGALQGASGSDPRWPWLGEVANDLRRAGPRALVLGGRALSAAASQSLAACHDLLGNRGTTVMESTKSTPASSTGSIDELAARAARGEVRTLFIFGGNPVYDAPTDLALADLLRRIPYSIHLAPYANETSNASTWTLHAAHDLEAWGDKESVDGTLAIAQPLIAPLYDGRSALELLGLIATGVEQSGYDLVRATWQSQVEGEAAAFETQWHRWLREGVVQLPPATAVTAPITGKPETPSAIFAPPSPPSLSSSSAGDSSKTWLSLRPSDTLWDGRHANNGWLQELADPITKLTWDNALLLSPATAKSLDVTDGDFVTLRIGGANLEAPALVVPGHADRCVTLPLGYGRTQGGTIGLGVGVNAYPLRRSAAPWFVPLDGIERTGRRYVFARTQEHSRVEGRDILHVARVDETAPTLVQAPPQPPMPSLYPGIVSEGHRWAMTIDLNSCIGCNACIIACQSENNIPVVGRQQVYMGREMQWIRVDRYYQGPEDNPRIHFQPVPCMQCENAPCEVVCPVAATQHDDEGLNVMVYNRCVGTRYCSNNCPYKVRRFNFLFYNADIPATQQLRLNPNVTVRSRGVMEKCTYCVQRIEEARIAARRESRSLRGGDIVTACQAACPAESIVFGDLSDPQSTVSKNRLKPGHYALLGELDTRPRTTYLEKRVNPNPALEPRADASAPAPI